MLHITYFLAHKQSEGPSVSQDGDIAENYTLLQLHVENKINI